MHAHISRIDIWIEIDNEHEPEHEHGHENESEHLDTRIGRIWMQKTSEQASCKTKTGNQHQISLYRHFTMRFVVAIKIWTLWIACNLFVKTNFQRNEQNGMEYELHVHVWSSSNGPGENGQKREKLKKKHHHRGILRDVVVCLRNKIESAYK